LSDAGAAVLLEESELATKFNDELHKMVNDAVLRERLAAKSYALGSLNRSSTIGSVIESVAR
jgi:UDP-N-acetylglucosamine:LPS N-acetylglucosamine transferase